MPILKKFLIFCLLATVMALPALAQTATTNYCGDYFRDQWNTRLDMSDAAHGPLQDIPDLEVGDVSAISYANGIASFTSTGTAPRLSLVQYTVTSSIPVASRYGELHPIDTSVYRYFYTRMYSSSDSTAQIIWQVDTDRYATITFPVYAGWQNYNIDLAAATPGNPSKGVNLGWTQSNMTGLQFIPVNIAGVTIQLDDIQLTRGDCGTYDQSYSGGSGLRRVIIDTDSDPTNGYVTASPVIAGSTHSIPKASLYPGTFNMYGYSSPDWKLITTGTAFNMDSSTDINVNFRNNIGSAAYSGGRFTGVTTGPDPSFYLNMPTGSSFSPSTYRYISVGIQYSGISTATAAQVFFFNTSGGLLLTYSYSPTNGYNTLNIPINSLSQNVGAIRIDPTDLSGVSFSLDFVAIRSDGYVATGSTPTISSLGTLTVDDISLEIKQPDERGGADFAQTELGRTWNMNSVNTFVQIDNVRDAKFYPHGLLTDPKGDSHIGDFFIAYNSDYNGDPIEYLSLQNNQVDTSKYVNFCFSGWNKNEDPVYNSVGRIIWTDPRLTAGSQGAVRNGNDIVFTRGKSEYCLDMRQYRYAQTEEGGGVNLWTNIGEAGAKIDFLRLDLNENEQLGYYSVLDYISLRQDQTADSQYAIVVDADTSKTVQLYYNTTASASGATAIGSLASSRNTNTYLWNTSSMPAGSYYIIATLTQGVNTLTRISKGRIVIAHDGKGDTTAPILNCDRPNTGYQFDNSLEVAGYALDDIRIASVEVFDQVGSAPYSYVKSVTRDSFNKAARDAYPNYADSNAPGFQEFIDSTSFATGSHNIKIVATDENGNTTSCIVPVVKSPGVTPLPYTYPTPNNSDFSVPTLRATATPTPTPTATATPTIVANPVLKVTASKDTVTFKVNGCSINSSIYAELTKPKVLSKPMLLGTIGANRTATAKKVSGLAAGQKSSFFLLAECNGKKSPVVTFNAARIVAKKKTSAAALLKLLKKNFAG